MADNNQTAADIMNELNLGVGVATPPEPPKPPKMVEEVPEPVSVAPKAPKKIVEGEPISDEELKSIEEKQAEYEAKISRQITQEVESSLTTQSNTDYETTVTLPSKGLIYGGKIPAEISLRGMTTRDEKILYVSQGSNVFQKLLKSCITDPKDLDTNKLIASDELFLVLQLRMITYGPDYKVDATCPICGQTNTYTVMLNELDVNYLDDDFKEPIEITLPRSGHKLSLKILRNEDSDFVERYAKKFAKQFNLNAREVEYTARIAKYITAIDGKNVDFETARDFVDRMVSRDSAEIRSAMNKILVGVDTRVTVDCISCGDEFTFSMPLTSEFFRPTFE